jgi:alginate O-acetyltransferase complex protein AlgI
MLFSSDVFLFFFLPLCVIGYAVIFKQARNAWLLAFSLLFYTWGGGSFVLWLLASIIGNFLFGLLTQWAVDRQQGRLINLTMLAAAAGNLALLGWFKYANFFVEQLTGLGAVTGIDWGLDWTNIALPIGISFFTFQALSYVLDIGQGRARAIHNPFDFALYVSLFPQLIAGPIVRYHEIAQQLQHRELTWDGAWAGTLRFVYGLCKKILIADSAAVIADAAFSTPGGELGLAAAWIGLVAYTIQIYFDFSGYSDMAIGLGMIFGFRFPENFRRPYSAQSITDFWRRWHMTLSAWFRDYLYIPLGGNRRGRLYTLRNLLVVFIATGLWHGAAWNFLFWGLFHGLLLIWERLRGISRRVQEDHRPLHIAGRRALTLLLVMMGWVLFRAETLPEALSYYRALFLPTTWALSPQIAELLDLRLISALLIGSAMFVLPGAQALGPRLTDDGGAALAATRLTIAMLALPLALTYVMAGAFSPFLYFRF